MESFPVTALLAAAALALVLALAWLILRALASFGPQIRQNPDIRVRSAAAVGNRERVVIVSCRGQDYLLGVSAGGITLLDKLPESAD